MIVRGHPHLDRQSDLTQALEEFKTVEMQPFLMVAVDTVEKVERGIAAVTLVVIRPQVEPL